MSGFSSFYAEISILDIKARLAFLLNFSRCTKRDVLEMVAKVTLPLHKKKLC